MNTALINITCHGSFVVDEQEPVTMFLHMVSCQQETEVRTFGWRNLNILCSWAKQSGFSRTDIVWGGVGAQIAVVLCQDVQCVWCKLCTLIHLKSSNGEERWGRFGFAHFGDRKQYIMLNLSLINIRAQPHITLVPRSFNLKALVNFLFNWFKVSVSSLRVQISKAIPQKKSCTRYFARLLAFY